MFCELLSMFLSYIWREWLVLLNAWCLAGSLNESFMNEIYKMKNSDLELRFLVKFASIGTKKQLFFIIIWRRKEFSGELIYFAIKITNPKQRFWIMCQRRQWFSIWLRNTMVDHPYNLRHILLKFLHLIGYYVPNIHISSKTDLQIFSILSPLEICFRP